MLTATAIFQNGNHFTQAFTLESERIIWIAELRSSYEGKGIPCPEIITGGRPMRKLTEQDVENLMGTSINGNYVCGARIKHESVTDSDHYGIILAKSKSGRYITWQFHLNEDENPVVYWGHYFEENHEKAVGDFLQRDADLPSLNIGYLDHKCNGEYVSIQQHLLDVSHHENVTGQ